MAIVDLQMFLSALTNEPPRAVVGQWEFVVEAGLRISARLIGARGDSTAHASPTEACSPHPFPELDRASRVPGESADRLVRDAACTFALPPQLRKVLARSSPGLGVLAAAGRWAGPSDRIRCDHPPWRLICPRLEQPARQNEIHRAEMSAEQASPKEIATLASQVREAATDDPVAGAISLGLSRNPGCPAVTLWQLAGRQDEWVDCALARRPDCPPELLTLIAQREGRAARWVVSNPQCPAFLLAYFVELPNLRDGVAGNPSASADLLQRLTQTGCSWLCSQLARNPSSTASVLTWVADECGVPETFDTPLPSNADLTTLAAVLHHPNAPVALISRLGGRWQNEHGTCAQVRIHELIRAGASPAGLLTDPGTTADVLLAMPSHANLLAVEEVILHPNCPESMVAEVVLRLGKNDVNALLSRPVLPQSVLRALLAWRGRTYWHDSDSDDWRHVEMSEYHVIQRVMAHPSWDDASNGMTRRRPEDADDELLALLLRSDGPLDLGAIEASLKGLDEANLDARRTAPSHRLPVDLVHTILERWLHDNGVPESLAWHWWA